MSRHLRALLPLLASAVSLPRLSNNTALPDLPAYKARSFWVGLITTLVVLLNTWQIDLLETLREMGLGATPEEVVAKGERAVAAWQMVAPLIGGIWIWLERRAPNFRLVWWGGRASTSALRTWFFAVLLVGLAYAAAHADPGAGPRGLV